MRTDSFDYHLPAQLIAKEPVIPRDSCRLMVLERSTHHLKDRHFFDLDKILQKGDVLVFNNSKVMPARILFSWNNKKVEIFLLRQLNQYEWIVLAKPGKLLQKGVSLPINKQLEMEVLDIQEDGSRLVRFSVGGKAFEEMLEKIGSVPLPPYIKNSRANFEDYQTVYAKAIGSVAAPTAGLHFTPRLLKKLEAKGVQLEFVTLHVGAGTFLPIKNQWIEKHRMHSEFFQLDFGTAKRLTEAKNMGRRLIAVGTTAVRVLESSFDTRFGFQAGVGETAIFIYPGYHWKCTDGLITNFHLPKSTLLLLTSSFGGKDFVLKAYQEAIKKHYRFYSFGDAMILL